MSDPGVAEVTARMSAEAPEWFRQAIAQHPTVATTEVTGTTISYRTWGAGDRPSVVLLHGGAAHARWWDHIAPFLAEDRQVIAFDLSGHGDSGYRDSYTIATWADEALTIAGLTASERPILIGHSLGGVVALQAAEIAGSRLGGIVMIDSPIVSSVERSESVEQRGAGSPRVYATREAVISRFRPTPMQSSLDYVRDYIADASVREVPGGWGWKFDLGIYRGAPWPPAPVPLDCPSTFFRGGRGMVTKSEGDAIFEALGRVTPVIEIPDAGHAMMLDQPIALVTGLRTVLAGW